MHVGIPSSEIFKYSAKTSLQLEMTVSIELVRNILVHVVVSGPTMS